MIFVEISKEVGVIFLLKIYIANFIIVAIFDHETIPNTFSQNVPRNVQYFSLKT